MAEKSKPDAGTKSQAQRFIEAARELEVDESGEAFEQTFGKIVRPAPRKGPDVNHPAGRSVEPPDEP